MPISLMLVAIASTWLTLGGLAEQLGGMILLVCITIGVLINFPFSSENRGPVRRGLGNTAIFLAEISYRLILRGHNAGDESRALQHIGPDAKGFDGLRSGQNLGALSVQATLQLLQLLRW